MAMRVHATAPAAKPSAGPAPFSGFELMMARKLITSRRKERFVSVIAWISVLGITLGVATLIIVMAVMNGFRQELLDKILGLNGHVIVYPSDSRFTDYRDVAEQLRGLDIVVN
ncbi:MAG: ABC transporter permease, partial [Hyphomicrobiales bacterium]|nr:ABC transporter permease [Hyphomicrobiales bacterium]